MIKKYILYVVSMIIISATVSHTLIYLEVKRTFRDDVVNVETNTKPICKTVSKDETVVIPHHSKDIRINAGVDKFFDQTILQGKYIRYPIKDSYLRSEPDENSKFSEIVTINTKLKCSNYNSQWDRVYYYDRIFYIEKSDISANKIDEVIYLVPYYDGFKSYMSYRAITSPHSNQKRLQNQATTSDNGLRIVENRYCVAIGSYFNCDIGQCFDLILENGEVIPCIAGDRKADKDTHDRIFTRNGCMSEFIVDIRELDHDTKYSGDVSNHKLEWDVPVKYVKVYNHNYL